MYDLSDYSNEKRRWAFRLTREIETEEDPFRRRELEDLLEFNNFYEKTLFYFLEKLLYPAHILARVTTLTDHEMSAFGEPSSRRLSASNGYKPTNLKQILLESFTSDAQLTCVRKRYAEFLKSFTKTVSEETVSVKFQEWAEYMCELDNLRGYRQTPNLIEDALPVLSPNHQKYAAEQALYQELNDVASKLEQRILDHHRDIRRKCFKISRSLQLEDTEQVSHETDDYLTRKLWQNDLWTYFRSRIWNNPSINVPPTFHFLIGFGSLSKEVKLQVLMFYLLWLEDTTVSQDDAVFCELSRAIPGPRVSQIDSKRKGKGGEITTMRDNSATEKRYIQQFEGSALAYISQVDILKAQESEIERVLEAIERLWVGWHVSNIQPYLPVLDSETIMSCDCPP
jgi:hypothetical protein